MEGSRTRTGAPRQVIVAVLALVLVAGCAGSDTDDAATGGAERTPPSTVRYVPLEGLEPLSVDLAAASPDATVWPIDRLLGLEPAPGAAEQEAAPAALPEACGTTVRPRALVGLERTWQSYDALVRSEVLIFEHGAGVQAMQALHEVLDGCEGRFRVLSGVEARTADAPEIRVVGAEDLATFASRSVASDGVARLRAWVRVGQAVAATTVIVPASRRAAVLDGTFESMVQRSVDRLAAVLPSEDEPAAGGSPGADPLG